ncbi:MFS transporter [Corynebacterium tapiri]|uniref:MHS family MFS transporter n=1 Tax=Corynebacterium tapiri TaxID=1448266 RepID=A0A5C4U2P7_9CORY|nr:MFS transporter [Corynebacterium tapiri]TNL96666.1 MHS family MFS transporter [Corynebacterium tapiri]
MTSGAPVRGNDSKQARRAAFGALAGSAIEWYDFFIYGTAAALVLGDLFFPGDNEAVKIASSLATFAIGFLLRPIGAILFGYIGDRVSRNTSLMITLVMMGGSTMAIGLLPTYHTIGIAAPIILLILRCIQGLSVGGEWGGAVLVASESAPLHRKVLAASMSQAGAPLGTIMSTLVFLPLSNSDVLYTWGWRVPFLLSAVLVFVGYIIRNKLEENPEFVQAKKRAAKTKRKAPLVEVLRHFPVTSLLVFLASFAVSGVYFRSTFALAWATNTLHIDKQLFLNALLFGAVIQLILTPTAALIADRIGVAKAHIAWTAIYLVVAPFPLMGFIATQDPMMIVIGILLSYLGHSLYYATLSGYLSTLFPPEVRFTGISFGYQMAGSLISSSMPLIAVRLVGADGHNILPVQLLYSALIAISLLAAILGPKSAQREASKYAEVQKKESEAAVV